MKIGKNLLLLLVTMFLLGGCSLGIGYQHGLCEDKGCNQAEIGVCDNPYNILLDKKKAVKRAYENVNKKKDY